MKRSTLTFLVVASGFYLLLIALVRGLLPDSVISTLPLLALPLVLLALILTINLSDRSIAPLDPTPRESSRRLRERDIKSLTRQVTVAANSSPAYFETILRSRLRDLLAEKVSLETGIPKDSVVKILADEIRGPQLLKDSKTYALLYYPPPRSPGSRLEMLREIIDRIEGWTA